MEALNASRRKSEPSSTNKTKIQASKHSSTQGKKQKKANPADLKSLNSNKVLASSGSMENLPGLTITPSPKSTPQPHPVSSSLAMAILPEPIDPKPVPFFSANTPAPALSPTEATAIDGPAPALNQIGQSEVASQVGEVDIPQKAEEEKEKGCNYSLTCELCQKEHKTLQSLYTHVIVHIRVELERKVKDLMEGFQCKV